jgi:hypothetical protein
MRDEILADINTVYEYIASPTKRGNTVGNTISCEKYQRDLSLMQIIFKQKISNHKTPSQITNPSKRDTFAISNEAQSRQITARSGAVSANRKIDQSIDMNSYLEAARTANREAIANVGDEIKVWNFSQYTSEIAAARAALSYKYSRLAQEAKAKPQPEQYIWEKYNDKNSPYYVDDLSADERKIAYDYENEILRTGTINSCKMGDSLFRGMMPMSETLNQQDKEFNRQMVNAQVNNILAKNGIALRGEYELSFTVCPFSFEISVEGADPEMKPLIEKALNVGENGKNLYYHISQSSSSDKYTSAQYSYEGSEKGHLYRLVADILGLDLRELAERDGTFFTDSGENVVDLYAKFIDGLDKSDENKTSSKAHFESRVRMIAGIGWKSIPDMYLTIGYNQYGLIDKYQDFGFGATSPAWLRMMVGDAWRVL